MGTVLVDLVPIEKLPVATGMFMTVTGLFNMGTTPLSGIALYYIILVGM